MAATEVSRSLVVTFLPAHAKRLEGEVPVAPWRGSIAIAYGAEEGRRAEVNSLKQFPADPGSGFWAPRSGIRCFRGLVVRQCRLGLGFGMGFDRTRQRIGRDRLHHHLRIGCRRQGAACVTIGVGAREATSIAGAFAVGAACAMGAGTRGRLRSQRIHQGDIARDLGIGGAAALARAINWRAIAGSFASMRDRA